MMVLSVMEISMLSYIRIRTHTENDAYNPHNHIHSHFLSPNHSYYIFGFLFLMRHKNIADLG